MTESITNKLPYAVFARLSAGRARSEATKQSPIAFEQSHPSSARWRTLPSRGEERRASQGLP